MKQCLPHIWPSWVRCANVAHVHPLPTQHTQPTAPPRFQTQHLVLRRIYDGIAGLGCVIVSWEETRLSSMLRDALGWTGAVFCVCWAWVWACVGRCIMVSQARARWTVVDCGAILIARDGIECGRRERLLRWASPHLTTLPHRTTHQLPHLTAISLPTT